MVKLKKLHGVEYQFASYNNETACWNSLDFIAEYLFSKDVGESLKKVIFIVVLCDGSTDVSVTAGSCEH